jgi:hypothetical protein
VNQRWQITGSKIEKLDLSSKPSPMASATSAADQYVGRVYRMPFLINFHNWSTLQQSELRKIRETFEPAGDKEMHTSNSISCIKPPYLREKKQVRKLGKPSCQFCITVSPLLNITIRVCLPAPYSESWSTSNTHTSDSSPMSQSRAPWSPS